MLACLPYPVALARPDPDVGTRLMSEDRSDLLDPERLVDRYGERIYQIAYRMMGNDSDAQDVAQNTLIKILQKADSYRGESDPMGWIYRIAMNEAREVFRRRKRRPAVSLDQLPVEFGDGDMPPLGIKPLPKRPDAGPITDEIDRVVRDAIQDLPDGYREAVVLTDLEGLSYRDAAELMDLSLGGFKTRLHRARLYLRTQLQSVWDEFEGIESGTSEAE